MPANPFGKNDPLAAGGGSAWGGAANAAPGGFGSAGADDYDVVEIVDEQPAAAAPSGPGLKGAGNTSSSNKNFALREANVSRREQEVRRREAALAARGTAAIDPMVIKNFPSCCPMVHHDIANDIPDYNKSLMRAGFMLFLLTCLALLWNLTAVILALIIVKFTGNAASTWFFAALYVVIGIPGAWFTWYGRLYRALMRDGALSWAGFFFFILVHLAFAAFSAIAPPLSEDGVSTEGLAYAHTGWMVVIDLFKSANDDGGYKFVAICYAVGASLWTLVGVTTVVLMGRVYVKMRGGTKDERAANAHMEMQKANEAAGP